MLRITVHDNPGSLTFQVEGKLVGPWVRELEDCCQKTLAGHDRTAVRVDLTGVIALDLAGKEFLSALHARGARFVAAGCLMRAVVAEIARAPIPDGGVAGER